MAFSKIPVRELEPNIVSLIADRWALLACEADGARNAMTVSWGALGELWGKDVVLVFVRPQRYTHELLENTDVFSLNFLEEAHRDAHKVFGSQSGRDVDKITACGFTPVATDGTFVFDEAAYAITARKIASQPLDPKGFLDASIAKNYKIYDYHTVFVGEILSTFKKL